jgi:hypothetical protein
LGCALFANAAFAQTDCDPEFVSIQPNFNRIIIRATENDDTDNIQCGFNLAIQQNIAEIFLGDAAYYLGPVIAVGYRGTVRGGGMNRTTLIALPERIDCNAIDRKPGLLKFSGGEVILKWLSIEGSSPCADSTAHVSLVHFTGRGRSDTDCRPDIVNAEVDRVRVTALDGGFVTGISASPEETEIDTCHDSLLGRFRLNRSTIFNAYRGLEVWMLGDAQVDVNFNVFENNDTAVFLINAEVEAKVSHCDFQSNDIGIFVSNEPTYAPESRILAIENNFRVTNGYGIFLHGMATEELPSYQHSRPIIIDNLFELGNRARAIDASSVSDGIVSGNTFKGATGATEVFTAVHVRESGPDSNIGCRDPGNVPWRWYIGNNDFSEFSSTIGDGISFGCVRQVLVGPGQNTTVDIWPFSAHDHIFLETWPSPFGNK